MLIFRLDDIFSLVMMEWNMINIEWIGFRLKICNIGIIGSN